MNDYQVNTDGTLSKNTIPLNGGGIANCITPYILGQGYTYQYNNYNYGLSIRQVNNGFILNSYGTEYVYESVESLLNAIGKILKK